MIISRVVFSLLTLGAISTVATPTPAPASDEKRADVSDVLGVVSTLGDATGSILPQIDSLVSSTTATADNVAPLLQELQAALNNAGTSLQGLENGFDASTGGSAQDVANAIAPIINNVVTTLTNLYTLNPRDFGFLIDSLGLEAALNTILVALGVLLPGILQLLTPLLGNVFALRSNLGVSLTGVTSASLQSS